MKKLNQNGFSHHLMIVGIAVLVVAAVGFAGFRVYKGRQLDAQAATYKWEYYQTNKAGLTYGACRIADNGPIKYYILNSTGTTYVSAGVKVGPNSNSGVIHVGSRSSSIKTTGGSQVASIQPSNYCGG